MLPQTQPRKKRNSSKVNLLISFIFHTLIVLLMVYLAARQGLLGKQLQKISIEMVKPAEKPKEPEKPKVEPPKIETPKMVEKPKMEEAKAAPPPTMEPPTVAPPATELPSFEFEGGKAVETSSDPVQLYKGVVEYALRSKWQRPENMADDNFVAEVEVSVGQDGRISNPRWKKESGDTRWDDSVRQALVAVTHMDRPPPTNFPPRIVVRFDVQEETETVMQ
jgi:outer membrane biosynthesis protein TonB